ncbi:FecR family protein [Chitinophaga sp. Cy-1792]|uniref:FecR family protein n=1 Tax=Chitinophaga sp. Cy-1792 TaxID=2608339 RepID=UPI00141DD853|nr:FecR domain-containing protein [Chitinophaga sp. Cy-1792]NIG55781.1 DUF4974 domain-containing protein [Chitinophaga sp. Cy-1792]
MENERVLFLLTRKLAGEATPLELDELSALLQADPSLQYSVSLLEQLESEAVLSPAEEDQLLQQRLSQLTLDETVPAKQYPIRSILKWAAAAVIGTLMVWSGKHYFLSSPAIKTISAKEIATKPGSRTSVVLEDGTKVWLNADSKIEAVKGKREVTLTGEAYFDVMSDANNPFIVHVSGVDVRVLGTTLNIRAYPGQGTVETALINGKLEVELKEGAGRKILLLPGQKATISTTEKNTDPAAPPIGFTVSNMTTDSATGAPPETGWMSNSISFKQQNLPDIIKELERWYGVNIWIENNRYDNEIITGTFKDKDLHQVLQALQLSAGFKYRTDSLGVHIY